MKTKEEILKIAEFKITSYGLKWFIKGMRQAVYIITKLK